MHDSTGSDPPQDQQRHPRQPETELEAVLEWGRACLSEQADRVEEVISGFRDPGLKEWIIAEVAARLIQKHPFLTAGSFDATIRTQLAQHRITQLWNPPSTET
jgi:hypothetical protein